jgi:hypothetical protein
MRRGGWWILSTLEEQDSDLIQVEVNEVLGLYSFDTEQRKPAKIAARKELQR